MNHWPPLKTNVLVMIGFMATAFVAVVNTVLNHHRMKGDGVSYLDLADGYLRMDLITIANSSWSPLYPIILALSKLAFKPTQLDEFQIAQIANFLVFIATLVSFHWLFYILCKSSASIRNLHSGYLISLSTFAYCSLSLISSVGVTPDMLLFCVLIILAGNIWQYARQATGGRAVFIGILCGLGFLCKAVFFIISPVILVSLGWLKIRDQKLRLAFLPIAGFLLVSVPWIIFLSSSKDRFTFSDIGWINYCIDVGPCVTENPQYFRRIDDDQNIVFYETQYKGVTFPPWFDLEERRRGTKINFSLIRQVEVFIKNIKHGISIVFTVFSTPFIVASFVFFCFARRDFIALFKQTWIFYVIGLSVGVYFISHVEERYVAPFAFILFIPFISTYLAAELRAKTHWLGWLLLGASAILAIAPIYPLAKAGQKMLAESAVNSLAAREARASGLEPGSQVVIIGDGVNLYWAKLAQVQIKGEFVSPERFWSISETKFSDLVCTLEKQNVRGVISTTTPPTGSLMGWKKLADGSSLSVFQECSQRTQDTLLLEQFMKEQQ